MNKSNAGFTLIELLVVIGIIALLAAFAVPTLNNAAMQAAMTNDLNNAHQIGLAMRMYAQDNAGAFVSGSTNSYGQTITSSNDAFRSLVPTYIDNEKVFTVPNAKVGATADNKISPVTEILKGGENCYAYVEGLNASSNSNWPLIVDETDGTGVYTTDQSSLGGTWKGTKAVVVHTDTSAAIVRLMGTGTQRFIPEFDDNTKNALTVSNYMGSGVNLLEPAAP